MAHMVREGPDMDEYEQKRAFSFNEYSPSMAGFIIIFKLPNSFIVISGTFSWFSAI